MSSSSSSWGLTCNLEGSVGLVGFFSHTIMYVYELAGDADAIFLMATKWLVPKPPGQVHFHLGVAGDRQEICLRITHCIILSKISAQNIHYFKPLPNRYENTTMASKPGQENEVK